MKKLSNYFKNKYIVGLILLIIAFIIYSIFSNKSVISTELVKVESGRLFETISLTGKVKTLNMAEMSIEKAGIVRSINFKVGDKVEIGDIIASLESSDILAQIQGAEANLMAEQARLNELEKGLRPEEITVEDSKLISAKTDFDDARIGIINAMHDAYAKSSSAVLNYSDTLFTNPQNAAPQFNIRANQEDSIIKNRVIIGYNFQKWKEDLDTMNLSTDPNKYLDNIHKYIEILKTFMGQISLSISSTNASNSGISQTTLDTYISNISSALSTFNSAVSSMATAEANYKSTLSQLNLINSQYTLKKAGSSDEALEIQRAKVAQAQANVALYRAELAKTRIISSINGIVGKVDLEIGEYVPVGKLGSVIVSDEFKIEINVPESDIAKIAIDNKATITLDAYDETLIFNAHVISIDLAETIVEGVPTYKVVLQFNEKDSRIRSGMTANINIITQDKENALLIPFRSIIDKGNKKFVLAKSNSNDLSSFIETPIKVGSRGNDGGVEVLEGLELGETIQINSK